MPNEMIQWIVGQAGLGAVAGICLLMVREAYKERREEKDRLMTTLENNTSAITALTKVLERNTDVADKCRIAQARD